MDKRRGDQAEARAQRPKDEPASPPHPRLQRYQSTHTMSYKDEVGWELLSTGRASGRSTKVGSGHLQGRSVKWFGQS
jgi:hypothetical protein